MEHQEALDILIAELLGQEIREGGLAPAQEHVSNCRYCLEQLRAALRLLGAPEEEWNAFRSLLTCEEARQLLAEYAELEEAEAKAQYPRVARHLETCADCRWEEQALRGWLATEREVPIPAGANFKTWVRAAAQKQPAGAEKLALGVPQAIWVDVEKQVRRLFSILSVHLEESGARLVGLAQALQPLQFVPEARRGARERPPAGLRLEDAELGIRIDLRFTSRSGLAVRLEKSGGGNLPVEGRLIVLPVETTAPAVLRARLPAGREVHVSLQSGKLSLRVEYGGRAWEIPLEIIREEA